MLTKSNALAFAVLAFLYNELDDDEVRNLFIEPYLNGRENGFSVNFIILGDRYFDRKLIFSKCRGTDGIVVYEGMARDFTINNGLTPELYNGKVYFDPGDFTDCVSRSPLS